MRYIYTTKQLLALLRSSGVTPNGASPFRALMTLNAQTPALPLREEHQLLCAFALAPEKTYAVGRHSSVDGPLYLLKIGAVYYLYTWLESHDRHVFEAFFDRESLIPFLNRNFCGFYKPNYEAKRKINLRLTEDEFLVWNLIRALLAGRSQGGKAENDPFPADDLKNPDLQLYLRNYLDEGGFSAYSDRLDLLMDEKRHASMDAALSGLVEKDVLRAEAVGFDGKETVYRLSESAVEGLDDGMLVDTVWFADRTDPEKPREVLLSLRRDGICALIPRADGVSLRTFDEFPWDDLL